MTERAETRPTVALLVVNNSGLGGTERRIIQVYGALKRQQVPVVLGINRALWEELRLAGLVEAEGSPDLMLEEPCAKAAAWVFGRTHARGGMSRFAFLFRKLDYLAGSLHACRWIMRRRPGVIHLVLGGAYLVLPLQWLRRAPPAIASVVGPLRDMVASGMGLRLYRRALREARLVDALTESVKETVRREGIPSERIRVPAGSCIDTDRFRPAVVKRPWIVFAGRLIEEKNPDLFIEACALVRARFTDLPGLRFVMLGDGPLRPRVESLAQRLGLAACLQIGWQERVEAVLAEASVFVSLQRTDNYPSQAVLEAMAAGAAVVATDVGLTWKLVDEGVGYRVKPEPASIAEAIIALLRDPTRMAALGRQARQRVLTEHSFAGYLTYVRGLYRMVGAS